MACTHNLNISVQRVMPTCVFILSRFTLRVDNVLFRNFDTRIYHSLSSSPPLVVRENSGWEAPYARVKGVGLLDHFPYSTLLTVLSAAAETRGSYTTDRSSMDSKDSDRLACTSDAERRGWDWLAWSRKHRGGSNPRIDVNRAVKSRDISGRVLLCTISEY